MDVFQNVSFRNMYVIDIETVPVVPDFDVLHPILKESWERKHECPDGTYPEEFFFTKSPLYAEFGKIVCISVGIFADADDPDMATTFRIKSFAGDGEREMLDRFTGVFQINPATAKVICGHNISRFDIPFICRRILINGLPLPSILDMSNRKPWDMPVIDTFSLWQFNDFKHFTSLEVLAHLFGLPNPKEDMKAIDVGKAYYREDGLSKIVEYCQNDVLTVAQLLLKLDGFPLLEEDQVIIVE